MALPPATNDRIRDHLQGLGTPPRRAYELNSAPETRDESDDRHTTSDFAAASLEGLLTRPRRDAFHASCRLPSAKVIPSTSSALPGALGPPAHGV